MMVNPTGMQPASSWALGAAAGVLAIALVLAVGVANLSRSMMSVGTSSEAPVVSITQEQPDVLLEKVVEVLDSLGERGYQARVLAKTGDKYVRTDELIQISVPDGTPFIMGVADDLHTGAIVHIRAKQGPVSSEMIVSRVVILTSNVTLE